MADNDFISRSREAGNDAAKRAQDALDQVLGQINRGRAATDRLLEIVDKELRAQIAGLRRDIEHLERRIAKLNPTRPARKPPAKKAAAKRAPAKKAPAKKAPAKKAPATRAPG